VSNRFAALLPRKALLVMWIFNVRKGFIATRFVPLTSLMEVNATSPPTVKATTARPIPVAPAVIVAYSMVTVRTSHNQQFALPQKLVREHAW
jgi:hypothetical protein